MGREGEDPFSEVVLDESFVRAATHHESSADARIARARREEALRERLRSQESEDRPRAPSRVRRPLRWRIFLWWQRLPVALRTTGALGVVLLVMWLPGSGWFGSSMPAWLSGDPVIVRAADVDRPPLAAAEAESPLGEPAVVPPGGGDHAFLSTQAESEAPVAYDPCRPIHVVINERTAPAAAAGLVEDALAEMSVLTGLSFVVEGRTDEPPEARRAAFQSERYGERWAPVLIAWSDPTEVPELEGHVAGIGGSTSATAPDENLAVYVSGIVALDGPALSDLFEYPDGGRAVRSVVLHELGHLVGLGHSDDPRQLMYGEGHPGIFEHQPGDLEGLARLGRGACVRRL